MNLFKSAFTAWLDTHPSVSLRALSQSSGVDSSMLSLIRKGTRSITFDALTKLLPAIAAVSSRQHAITLHIAYLSDETAPDYKSLISIQSSASQDGQLGLDVYQRLAAIWEHKARHDPVFYRMWKSLDDYMHDPAALDRALCAELDGQIDETDIHPECDIELRERDIALVAEDPPEYKVTKKPSSGHPQDTIRHDPMPSQHAAQEHHEP